MRVRLDRVGKSFGDVAAVHEVSIDVASGHLCAFLGPSGCGKTTCLNVVAGFLAPDAGEVVIGERVVTAEPPHRRGTGMVFQGYALFPHLTVAQNVGFGLKLRGVGRGAIAARTREFLDLVRLGGTEGRYPRELSGGQQQRVALARALVIEPDVLLLDEPLSNLDANLREQMRDEIRRIQRALGTTTIFVTHDQSEAMAIADQIVVLNGGRVEQSGRPEEVYDRPRTAFVAGFMGAANLIPVARVRAGADGVRVDLAGGGAPILLPPGTLVPEAPSGLVVRPEHLTLGARGEVGRPGTVFRDAVFRDAVFLGADLLASFELGGTRLRARLDPGAGARLVAGEAVSLVARADKMVLVP